MKGQVLTHQQTAHVGTSRQQRLAAPPAGNRGARPQAVPAPFSSRHRATSGTASVRFPKRSDGRLLTVVQAAARTAAAPAPPAPPAAEPVEVEYSVHAVTPSVKLLRGTCRAERLKYEVEYGLKRGTSDNCYLATSDGDVMLFDVPFEAYAAKFVDTLEAQGTLASLTHIVLTQLDPKAIPSLELLLRRRLAADPSAPKPQVILSNPALRLLQSALGEKPEKAELLSHMQLVVARAGAVIAQGAGQMEIILTPTPRWPDLMAVYCPSQRLLFSSKLFSAHVAEGQGDEAGAFDAGGWEAFGEDWRYFFDCMLAPAARQAAAALGKLDIEPVPLERAPQRRVSKTSAAIKGFFSNLLGGGKPKQQEQPQAAAAAPVEGSGSPLLVSMLLPMHGPVVTSALAQLAGEYRAWVDAQLAAATTSCVAVLYASAYGNTAALAQAISRGITKGGVAVETLNLELVSLEEVSAAIKRCNGFVLGSPTLGGHMPTQVSVSMGAILRETSAKQLPCGVFGSFGWSGEAVDEMEGRLRDAGFGFAFDAIRVKFKPTAKDLLLCEESGRALAQSVKKKLKARELSSVAAPGGDAVRSLNASGSQLAMGRVVGSLSVITARDEDATSAMLASWISQASFDPPGLTVAVKKDRAIEKLMVTGAKFAVSFLAEGREKGAMKRLTRPFSPGEDRLAGLETQPSPATGCPVLKDANAFVDCTVVSKMEAGDHYLVYAHVLDGKVLDESAPTAVHHRKVGNHY